MLANNSEIKTLDKKKSPKARSYNGVIIPILFNNNLLISFNLCISLLYIIQNLDIFRLIQIIQRYLEKYFQKK